MYMHIYICIYIYKPQKRSYQVLYIHNMLDTENICFKFHKININSLKHSQISLSALVKKRLPLISFVDYPYSSDSELVVVELLTINSYSILLRSKFIHRVLSHHYDHPSMHMSHMATDSYSARGKVTHRIR